MSHLRYFEFMQKYRQARIDDPDLHYVPPKIIYKFLSYMERFDKIEYPFNFAIPVDKFFYPFSQRLFMDEGIMDLDGERFYLNMLARKYMDKSLFFHVFTNDEKYRYMYFMFCDQEYLLKAGVIYYRKRETDGDYTPFTKGDRPPDTGGTPLFIDKSGVHKKCDRETNLWA